VLEVVTVPCHAAAAETERNLWQPAKFLDGRTWPALRRKLRYNRHLHAGNGFDAGALPPSACAHGVQARAPYGDEPFETEALDCTVAIAYRHRIGPLEGIGRCLKR